MNTNSQIHHDYLMMWLRVNGCYFWYNVFQIVLTIALLDCLYQKLFHIILILEILIAFLIAADLIFKYFVQGPPVFLKDADNKINITVLALLIVSIFSEVVFPQFVHHQGQDVAGFFLIFRYFVQVARFIKLIIDSKKELQVSKHQTVSLHQHIEEE